MAATGTPTPNLGLRRAQGTDPASVDDINYNSELLDTKLGAVGGTSVQGQIDALSASTAQTFGNVQDGLAIVSNGNTHVAIPAGYWVYVKGHGTLSEGLYKNTSGATIAANATLSTSNLTADPDGGLNSVYDALNSKFRPSEIQSINNIDGLKTYLLNMFNSIGDRECIAVCFQSQFEDNNFIAYGVYHGLLYRSLTGYFTCTVSDNNGNMTVISYSNGQNWTFESFKSLNSKVRTDVVTTRDGNAVFLDVNSGFLSSGKITCTLIDKQLTLCVEGISTKNTADWIGQLWQEYRPGSNADYYFTYYLGNEIKRGYVNSNGYIYFEALNTTDMINATIVVNVP